MILLADKIITGDGITVLDNYAVKIDDNGIIINIDREEKIKEMYPDDEWDIRKGTTLVPGFVDTHVHIGYFYNEIDSSEENDFSLAYRVMNTIQAALSNGVVALRDVASPENIGKAINTSEKKGYFVAPKVVATGAGICMTGGHFYHANPGVIEYDGTLEIIRAVRQRAKDGYKWVKILTSHRSEYPEFTQEEITAAADEAHRLGLKIAAHASSEVTVQQCINANFDSIEHATMMTDEQVKQMIEKNITWVPTVLVYTNSYMQHVRDQDVTPQVLEFYKKGYEAYQNNFKKYFDTGIKICVGTDIPDMPVAKEMQAMVKLGITPLQAIKIGTYNGAELLDISDTIGDISVGKRCDVVFVNGDAEHDIDALECVDKVYFKGKPVCKVSKA